MGKQQFLLIILIISILFTFGCAIKRTPSMSLWSVDENGYSRFYTKKPAHYNYFFMQWNNVIERTPMDIVETTVKKMSGSDLWGYGVVFCFQDEDNFYRLLINNKGWYEVSKTVNGKWTYDLVNNDGYWEVSQHLNTGYNVENKIKVKYNNDSTFTIFFNDQEVTTFTDDSLTGGKFGFCAQVGRAEDENFPTYPVDVRFKQHKPVEFPAKSWSNQISNYDYSITFGMKRQ